MGKEKTHNNIVVVGRVDSGQSNTTGLWATNVVELTKEPSNNLRRRLLRWKRTPSSLPGS